ncbi:uncharacterized protein KY384_003779 [Bacidia gigantensis]|uniref:uncharacterized protein n=1 Tax=Bacidia gigantensis TaxID=2732470 RepID=UPI001D04ABAB|nr:uncharacterized protein KY384_003779 [Bacidia gigantensis]KAG8532140.1 hypothetical protein KY384_003779 [Bacidia gigantensis]
MTTLRIFYPIQLERQIPTSRSVAQIEMPLTRNLPQAYKALVQETYGSQLTLQTISTPAITPGSAIVHILAAPIPLVRKIGRVVEVRPDAMTLEPGDLVGVGGIIRGRDDGDNRFLQGLHDGFSEDSELLTRQVWPNSGTFAEHAKVPIRLTAGERVIISPATGSFGGAAAMVALAMGAMVVVFGRNGVKLKQLKALDDKRIDLVQVPGDVAKDTAAWKSFGAVDALFDISPPMAASSTHLKSGDIDDLLKLVIGEMIFLSDERKVRVIGKFGLEARDEAFETAAANPGFGQITVFTPRGKAQWRINDALVYLNIPSFRQAKL